MKINPTVRLGAIIGLLVGVFVFAVGFVLPPDIFLCRAIVAMQSLLSPVINLLKPASQPWGSNNDIYKVWMAFGLSMGLLVSFSFRLLFSQKGNNAPKLLACVKSAVERFVIVSVFLLAVGCATHQAIEQRESQPAAANPASSEGLNFQNAEPYTVPAGWQLVWNDEFDGTTLDTNKWTAYVGNTTGGNVYYTSRPKNVYVANGLLHLVARHKAAHGYAYTSGQVRTEFKYWKKYGLIVARMRMPAGEGFWPAFWMLGTNYDPNATWPHCGEIDIPESAGGSPTWVQGTIHNADANGQDTYQTMKYYFPTPGDSVTNFHTYGILWTSNSIIWQVDGLNAQTWTNWGAVSGTNAFPVPFNQPFFFLLQLAVTRPGGYGGSPNARTPFPSEVQVDYVRVYDQPAATTPGSGANPAKN